MDYVKEAESYLKHYASLKKAVEHAKFMIDKIAYKACPGELGAVENDITGISAQHPINTLQEMYELMKWQDVYKNSQQELQHVTELLDSLDERERKILMLWYIEKMSAADIAVDMKFEERRSVYNLKSKALKNFSIILFGIGALKAI